jgi:hypothetical protein
MELFSYILSHVVHHWCIERLLILYPALLLKVLMVSRSFWVEFLGSLRYSFMLSANRDTLTIYLPICIHFMSSSCFISLARNSRTMWNRSGDSGHLCLIPDFWGNGFSFSPFV